VSSRLWWGACLLIVLCGFPGAWAQEGDREPLYILVVNGEGEWEPEQQAYFKPPASLGKAVSTDWKALTHSYPLKILSYGDRVKLLKRPRRLLSSTWASNYFTARHIMLLEPSAQGRLVGRLFDTKTGRKDPVVVTLDDGDFEDAEEARAEALAEAATLAEVATVPVAAHPRSELYHKTDASHLSPRVAYQSFDTGLLAEVDGFGPCRICYPESSRTFLYDKIDHRLGEIVASNIENRYRLAPDGPDTQRVQEIGQRLLRQNGFLDQGYRFIVLDTDTINAYAAPTGPIYITAGMLEILESDDELAAILGHELSHSERKHARQQYERSQAAGVVGLLVTVATRIPWARLGSDILATVLVRGYNRGYELEADRDGMTAAYAAGYVPHDFLLVQEKLQQLSEQRGGGGPDWLRTHPRGDERLGQLEELLEETSSVRERLDRLESTDPGMARYLKSRLLHESTQDELLEDYLKLYFRVLGRVRVEQVEPERHQDFSEDEVDEFWEAVEMMFEAAPILIPVMDPPEDSEPNPGP
jgi:Zn-dependent protease with chaperone function